jgi:hypothetical protein
MPPGTQRKAPRPEKRVRALDPITDKEYWIPGSGSPEQQALWRRVDAQARLLKLSPTQLRGVVDSQLEMFGNLAGSDHILRALGWPVLPADAPWTRMLHELAALDAGRRLPKTAGRKLERAAEGRSLSDHFIETVDALPEAQQWPTIRAFLGKVAAAADPSAIVITHSVAFGYADEWFNAFKADIKTGLSSKGHLPGTRRRPSALEWFMFLTRPPGAWNYVQLSLWRLPRTQRAVWATAKSIPRSTS